MCDFQLFLEFRCYGGACNQIYMENTVLLLTKMIFEVSNI